MDMVRYHTTDSASSPVSPPTDYSISPQDFFVPFPSENSSTKSDPRLSIVSAEQPARPRKGSRSSRHQESRPSERPSSKSSSYSPSIYAPPTRPLPPIPGKRSSRVPSQDSFDKLSLDTRHLSLSSDANSASDLESLRSSFPKPPSSSYRSSQGNRESFRSSFPKSPSSTHRTSKVAREEIENLPTRLALSAWKRFECDKKKKNCVHYLDLSSSTSTLASKHGNNNVRVWSVEDGSVQNIIKFSSYTEPQSRSRDYMIRSHAILSELTSLIAIATRFGRSVEIFNWVSKKSLQTIDNADRWVAGSFGNDDIGCGALAVYQNANHSIQTWTFVQEKKPFGRAHTIDLRKADLPFMIQFPEVALSPTSPMLVAAAGPRPPRPGHPPPDNETLVVAWTIGEGGGDSSTPFMMTRPSIKHPELDTAIPCELATYGSVVVSVWIPASYKVIAVPREQNENGWSLTPVPVPHRYVLVWDLTSNSTRTFRIPDTTSCVSPDCRLVAYCAASTSNMGGKGYLSILDVITGREVWCYPDPEATATQSGPREGFEQFDALSRVTELKFSSDGLFLIVGDVDGTCCMYKLHEQNEAL